MNFVDGVVPSLVAMDAGNNIFLARGADIELIDITGADITHWHAATPPLGVECVVVGAAFFPDDAVVVFSDAGNHCLLVSNA